MVYKKNEDFFHNKSLSMNKISQFKDLMTKMSLKYESGKDGNIF